MSDDAAAPPSLPTARELRERALLAQSELKHRLSSLSQESRELDGRLRGSAGKRGSGAKRSRDERGDPRQDQQEQERSAKARRDSDEVGQDKAAASGAEEAAPELAAKPVPAPAPAPASVGDGKGDERRAARRAAQERAGGAGARRSEAADGAGPSRPERPSPRTKEDADTRQRNRKMFGVLTAQLQRASKEHSEQSGASGSLAAQQQKLAKVDERLRESGEKLREFERSFVDGLKDADRRRREQIREQRAQLDERLLQLKWDAHGAALSQFLVTEVAGSPPIYYLPRRHSAATRAKLEQQQRARLQALAGSAALKENPLEGLDLATEPPPAAAAAAAAASTPAPDVSAAPAAALATDAAANMADAPGAAGSSDAPAAEAFGPVGDEPVTHDSAAMEGNGGAADATADEEAPEAPPAAAPAPAEPAEVQEPPTEATRRVDDGGDGVMLEG